jgi:hypothetical protein
MSDRPINFANPRPFICAMGGDGAIRCPTSVFETSNVIISAAA